MPITPPSIAKSYRADPKILLGKLFCTLGSIPEGRVVGSLKTGSGTMFERRRDPIRFLAVAKAGKIFFVTGRLPITQPALSRAIAKLETRDVYGVVFEGRLETGDPAVGERATARRRAQSPTARVQPIARSSGQRPAGLQEPAPSSARWFGVAPSGRSMARW